MVCDILIVHITDIYIYYTETGRQTTDTQTHTLILKSTQNYTHLQSHIIINNKVYSIRLNGFLYPEKKKLQKLNVKNMENELGMIKFCVAFEKLNS